MTLQMIGGGGSDANKADLANPTGTGVATWPALSASGKNGASKITFCGITAAAGAPTASAWLVGDLIIDPNGVFYRCTVAGTPGTWVNHQPGQMLCARVIYQPAAQTVISTTSTSHAALDTTNLRIVVPGCPSGNVLVRLSASTSTGSGTYMEWGLLEGATIRASGSSGSQSDYGAVQIGLIVAIANGSSKTLDWAHRRATGSNSAQSIYGGPNSGVADSSAPAVMEAFAI